MFLLPLQFLFFGPLLLPPCRHRARVRRTFDEARFGDLLQLNREHLSFVVLVVRIRCPSCDLVRRSRMAAHVQATERGENGRPVWTELRHAIGQHVAREQLQGRSR